MNTYYKNKKKNKKLLEKIPPFIEQSHHQVANAIYDKDPNVLELQTYNFRSTLAL